MLAKVTNARRDCREYFRKTWMTRLPSNTPYYIGKYFSPNSRFAYDPKLLIPRIQEKERFWKWAYTGRVSVCCDSVESKIYKLQYEDSDYALVKGERWIVDCWLDKMLLSSLGQQERRTDELKKKW
jgi:hypothetical protein